MLKSRRRCAWSTALSSHLLLPQLLGHGRTLRLQHHTCLPGKAGSQGNADLPLQVCSPCCTAMQSWQGREGAKRKLDQGLIFSRPANKPHLVYAENEAAASYIVQGVCCPAVCSCGGGCPSSSQKPRRALFTSVQL